MPGQSRSVGRQSARYRKSNNLASSVLASNKSKLSEERAAARASISFLFFISLFAPLTLGVCRQFPHYSNGTLLGKGLPPTSSSRREGEQAPGAFHAAPNLLLFRSEVVQCPMRMLDLELSTRVDRCGEESAHFWLMKNAIPLTTISKFVAWSKIDNWYRHAMLKQCFP